MNFQSLLIIDSKDRSYGTNEDFNYQVRAYGPQKIKAYRVNKVNIPFSWYNLRNQDFQLNVAGVPHIISFPEGSYTSQSLITKLTALITPITPITITYDQNTNKFTFTAVPSLQFIFSYNMYNYSLERAIGFLQTSAISSTLTSSFCANLNSTLNVYIYSQFLSLYTPAIFNKDRACIIQTVPIQVNSFNFINWENSQETYFNLGNENLDNIDLKIVDDYGNTLNLNGLCWTCELQLFQ